MRNLILLLAATLLIGCQKTEEKVIGEWELYAQNSCNGGCVYEKYEEVTPVTITSDTWTFHYESQDYAYQYSIEGNEVTFSNQGASEIYTVKKGIKKFSLYLEYLGSNNTIETFYRKK